MSSNVGNPEDEDSAEQRRIDDKFFGGSEYWCDQVDPTKGLSPWTALYHHINREMAREIYDLKVMGFDDESRIDEEWSQEVRDDFQSKHGRFRFLLFRLEMDLVRKLVEGQLVAYGYSSTASLDAPRQKIARERWRDLDINLLESTAAGPGLAITQILVLSRDQVAKNARRDRAATKVSPASPQKKYSETLLRDWYVLRAEKLTLQGVRSSREKDYQDANLEFGGYIPWLAIGKMRREHAPAFWRRKGRPNSARLPNDPKQ